MGKPRRNPVTDEQIIESYRRTFSSYKTAKEFGVASSTVERVLINNKEPRNGLAVYRQNAAKFRGKEAEIRAAYEGYLTFNQMREKFGPGSDDAFRSAVKRAGGELFREGAPYREKPGEIDLIRTMNKAGMGQVPISLAIGRSQSFVGRIMRKYGIQPLSGFMNGENHPNWKGGRYKDGNGYIRVHIPRDDPLACMALNDGTVLEHRIVMARKLGRPLTRKETCHHIDGNRENNHPDNLQLRMGKHGKHEVVYCLDCGSHNIGHKAIADAAPHEPRSNGKAKPSRPKPLPLFGD